MKPLLKKLRFHKADEMERAILLRAQRNSYIFLVAALFIWSLYESCRVYLYHTRLNPLPCLLLAAAAVVQVFSQLLLTRRAVQGDEDSHETGPLLMLVALVCAIAAIAATAAAAAVFMVVRL